MATWYLYECNKCHYQANISGRSDALFSGQTETKVCLNCKELSDYVVLTDDHKIVTEIACENCGKQEVVNWNYKTKPCPKCENGKMKKPKMGTITHAD
jgi:hypothetical protein